MSLGCST